MQKKGKDVPAEGDFVPNDVVIARGKMSRKVGVNGMKGLIVDLPGVPAGPGWRWVEFGEREFALPVEELTLDE